jgi:glutamine cyclotransferase
VRDRKTFELRDTLVVTEDGLPLSGALNELECVKNRVYANLWPTFELVVIDAATGEVTTRVDAYGLLSPEEELRAGELNGIAFDQVSEKLYVTGKLWPKIFEISIPGEEEGSRGGRTGCTLEEPKPTGWSIGLLAALSCFAHVRVRSRRKAR